MCPKMAGRPPTAGKCLNGSNLSLSSLFSSRPCTSPGVGTTASFVATSSTPTSCSTRWRPVQHRLSSNEFELLPKPDAFPPKTRSLCGFMRIRTPNSSRFARNVHSRILQKFPFLVEMFYWAIALALYRGTGAVAQLIYGGHREMWDSAADHGLAL